MEYQSLEAKFYETRELDRRDAAEIAYVLASLHLREGNIEKASVFGKECIWLFDQCRMETIEDCAARFVTLEGIALPSLIHQDVVRDRLKELKL